MVKGFGGRVFESVCNAGHILGLKNSSYNLAHNIAEKAPTTVAQLGKDFRLLGRNKNGLDVFVHQGTENYASKLVTTYVYAKNGIVQSERPIQRYIQCTSRGPQYGYLKGTYGQRGYKAGEAYMNIDIQGNGCGFRVSSETVEPWTNWHNIHDTVKGVNYRPDFSIEDIAIGHGNVYEYPKVSRNDLFTSLNDVCDRFSGI